MLDNIDRKILEVLAEDGGFVAKMDDLKPICWIRTPAGTAAMISLPRGGAKTLVEEMEAYA
jgi:hypothetical protein